MHCSNEDEECSKRFFKCPSIKEFDEYKQMILEYEGEEAAKEKTLVPKCESCGANMKPHCMFFDESYSEHYYRR